MSAKTMNIKVQTIETELEFSIHSSTTGQQLFDQVAKTIGLREIWFFGLQYTDSADSVLWLKLDKKIMKHDFKQDQPFKFLVKLYPEDATQDIIQEVTLRLFYLQVKEEIMKSKIICSPESAVLLASYVVQCKFGDYSEEYTSGFIDIVDLLPQRILSQYRMSVEDWEERVIGLWKGHKGISRESSMVDYLKIAQEFEMYGVSYFEISNKKGNVLFLGVDAHGLNVYEYENKLVPKIGFSWSETRSLSFNNRRFTVKSIDKKSKDFSFSVENVQINKEILALCVGNHELYMRKRKPETIEIQQIKQQAKEERLLRELEQARLNKETEAREMAEAKQREYEEKLEEMRQSMELKEREIEQAYFQIRELEQQLIELNKAKEELQRKEVELNHLNNELSSERALSAEERKRLIDEVAARENQIAEMRLLIKAKTNKSNELRRSIEHRTPPKQINLTKNDETDSIEDHLDSTQSDSEESLMNVTIDLSSDHDPKFDEASLKSDDEEEDVKSVVSNTDSEVRKKIKFFQMQGSQVSKRLNLAELDKSMSVKERMQALSEKINLQKDSNEIIGKENVRVGPSKREVALKIQKGNTKRRVDQFESM